PVVERRDTTGFSISEDDPGRVADDFDPSRVVESMRTNPGSRRPGANVCDPSRGQRKTFAPKPDIPGIEEGRKERANRESMTNPHDNPTPPQPQPAADLLREVYAELRRLAGTLTARLPPGQTLQPTALVHEAYLKLVRDQDPGWQGR